jgi:hypothetical protein
VFTVWRWTAVVMSDGDNDPMLDNFDIPSRLMEPATRSSLIIPRRCRPGRSSEKSDEARRNKYTTW